MFHLHSYLDNIDRVSAKFDGKPFTLLWEINNSDIHLTAKILTVNIEAKSKVRLNNHLEKSFAKWK